MPREHNTVRTQWKVRSIGRGEKPCQACQQKLGIGLRPFYRPVNNREHYTGEELPRDASSL